MVNPDIRALTNWLRFAFRPLREPVVLRRFTGGQSNPTYALETPGEIFVLRMKPLGPLLPSAHQIEREYRVLRALESTIVPLPRAFALCEDPSVLGAPFFVMQHLHGRVFSDPALPGIPSDQRRAVYESAFAVLADLHSLDFRALGLADYGRADGYLMRQVRRWTQQYRASQTDDIPSMDALIDWLPENVPAGEEAAIAHGDYRIGNLMFAPDEPRVIGILDWELSTIGHPLLDLAYALSTHAMPLDVVCAMGGSVELANVPGIPTASSLTATYCRIARRADPANLVFFLALAFFRSAAIMQGIRHRLRLGNAAGGAAAELRAAATARLAELGWNLTR